MICLVIKLIGCLLIASAGFFTGCVLTQRLKNRRNFYDKFCVFISLLQTQIRYNSADIFSLVISSARGSGLELFDTHKSDVPFTAFWENSLNTLPKKYGLNNSDKELLSEFGSALGTTDIEGQLKHLGLYGEIFQNRLSECENALKDKSRIYRALGLFGGISTAIIIL